MNIRLSQLARRYAGGETVADVMTQVLADCDTYGDPAVFIKRLDNAAVLARTTALDATTPTSGGRLHGVPYAVKDNLCGRFADHHGHGRRTTFGNATATAVQPALDQGSVLIG